MLLSDKTLGRDLASVLQGSKPPSKVSSRNHRQRAPHTLIKKSPNSSLREVWGSAVRQLRHYRSHFDPQTMMRSRGLPRTLPLELRGKGGLIAFGLARGSGDLESDLCEARAHLKISLVLYLILSWVDPGSYVDPFPTLR